MQSAKCTTAGVVEIPPHVVIKPADLEFIRMPPSGQRCPLTGLSRGALATLIYPLQCNDFKPPVRSFVLRQRGSRTGCRIIDYQSLRQWILSHEDKFQDLEKEGRADN